MSDTDEWVRFCDPVEELPGRVIDVMVWGASRPDLFRRTAESLRRHLRFSGELRYFLEDGAFDAARAGESAVIARAHGFAGVHVERVGSYGWAMTNAFNRWSRAPLLFSVEDDMECLREIDLDLCFDAFAENPHLNQLRYNRTKNAADQNDGAWVFPRRTLRINGREWPVLGSAHWYFGPAVWRMSFVRPRWRGAKDNIHFYMNSSVGFLPDGPRPSPEWYADTLGVLTWGAVREPAYFLHTGREQSIHAAQGRV